MWRTNVKSNGIPLYGIKMWRINHAGSVASIFAKYSFVPSSNWDAVWFIPDRQFNPFTIFLPCISCKLPYGPNITY